MAQKITWKPAARIKVYANGRKFRELVIDSATYLDEPEITGTRFENCSFSYVRITDSTIRFASFDECQITNSRIRSIVCVDSEFAVTSFKNVDIDAVFIGCHFYDVDFTLCGFSRECRFVNCRFEACSFPGTIFDTPMETFSGSLLCDCRDIPFIPTACPETGEFIGYKKGTAVYEGGYTSVLIKLLIPEMAARSSATGRKCRCGCARVLSIEGIGSISGIEFDEARSIYDPDFIYRTGELVLPDEWDEDRWDTCSHGIHFFMSRQEAIDY